MFNFLIVALSILTSSKPFIYQQMQFISSYKPLKFTLKQIETAPTCFGLRPSSPNLQLSLDKISFIKIVDKKEHVFMVYAVVWQHVISSPWWCVFALCVLHNTPSTHTPPWTWYNTLPHHRIAHKDVLLPTTFIIVTSARLKYKLPDDGRRPKHVAAVSICFNVNFSGF